MGLFTTKELNTLEDLLVDQLRDLYDAEQRLAESLPMMADSAHSPELKQAFVQHTDETKGQINRLESVFHSMGRQIDSVTCDGIKGIISECQVYLDAQGDPDVRDAALIACAQRAEHYEIAAYGCVRTYAQQLGRDDIASLLQTTLDEEGKTDHRLTELAEQSINLKAEHSV
jgi:ferritin-like metal-binding protein YciE